LKKREARPFAANARQLVNKPCIRERTPNTKGREGPAEIEKQPGVLGKSVYEIEIIGGWGEGKKSIPLPLGEGCSLNIGRETQFF